MQNLLHDLSNATCGELMCETPIYRGIHVIIDNLDRSGGGNVKEFIVAEPAARARFPSERCIESGSQQIFAHSCDRLEKHSDISPT